MNYQTSSLYMILVESHLKPLNIRTSPGAAEGFDTENPMNRLSVSGTEEDAQDKHTVMNQDATASNDEWRYATSIDITQRGRSRSRSHSVSLARPTPAADTNSKIAQKMTTFLRNLFIPVFTSIHEIRTMNVSAQFRKATVLNRRAFYALFKREKLVIGTTLMYLYIAVFTCFIIKDDQENNPGIATANSMFGAFLLLVSQLQYVFFLLNNHKVH